MKDEHIAGIDVSANPIAANRVAFWNLRDKEILILVILKTEFVRAFQNPQRSHIRRAIVEWNPHCKALGISPHESVILMCMDREAFAVREDQASDWLWMDQEPLTHDHFHDTLQRWMMWQSVKGSEIEDLLIGPLEPWVWIAASSLDIRDALKGIMTGKEPARAMDHLGNLA
jgi:hypothetical protein